MDEEQNKFFNVIIEKTNQRLNSLQAQVIVLESQLQIVIDEKNAYKKYVDEGPSQHAVSLAARTAELEVKNAELEVRNTAQEQQVLSLTARTAELEVKNAELGVKNVTLQEKTNPSVTQEQNETLAHEVRRLQQLVDKLS